MIFKEYDVVIVGSGVSGLYAALNLDSSMKILMLSKKELRKRRKEAKKDLKF